jgi:hypothetical protein
MDCNEFPREMINKQWGEIYKKAKSKIHNEVSSWENVTEEDIDMINTICNIWDGVVEEVLTTK